MLHMLCLNSTEINQTSPLLASTKIGVRIACADSLSLCMNRVVEVIIYTLIF